MDYLIKWSEAKAILHATGQRVAEFIYQTIICRHECPKQILSDHETHFRNEIVEALLQKFQIWYIYLTPYYPQTNGLVEWFNRTYVNHL